jgi:hypothetical protein
MSNVLVNIDPDRDLLLIISSTIQTAASFWVYVAAEGSIAYRPDHGYHGADTFS